MSLSRVKYRGRILGMGFAFTSTSYSIDDCQVRIIMYTGLRIEKNGLLASRASEVEILLAQQQL